jgi:hypothetical protein
MSGDASKGGRGFVLGEESGSSRELPRIDFSTFALSLAASALLHLGLAPDPSGGSGAPEEPNLPLARQAIDTLEMIAEKTQGNLDPEESKLLQSLLYELRMNVIRVEKGA